MLFFSNFSDKIIIIITIIVIIIIMIIIILIIIIITIIITFLMCDNNSTLPSLTHSPYSIACCSLLHVT